MKLSTLWHVYTEFSHLLPGTKNGNEFYVLAYTAAEAAHKIATKTSDIVVKVDRMYCDVWA